MGENLAGTGLSLQVMYQINNIRFTYQYPLRMVPSFRNQVGISGGSSEGRASLCARFTTEVAMTPRHRIVQQIAVPLVRAIRALGAVSAAPIAHLAKILRHRRDLEFLAGLDDRMLRDIGLTRSDLRFALSEPVWRDPGAVLVGRVGRRGLGKSSPTSVPSIAPARGGWGARAIGSPVRTPRRAA
ncbi:MAG TPA: DUF1127 domain-containing protein [Xanthobacteraceae bacterium]|nr:DUF1127 domain-containing protein [Xanthobacteraceae bacterium]